jgi:hypothetical protein
MITTMARAHDFQADDPRLLPICDKVMSGLRLSAADALTLYRTGDILAVGWLANCVRERLHGDRPYFQRQSAHQPNERLRRRLPSVRLWPQEGYSRRVHHGAGRGV